MARAKKPDVDIAVDDGWVIWVRLDTNPANWIRYAWGYRTPGDAARAHADLIRGNRQVVESKTLYDGQNPVSGSPPSNRMSLQEGKTQGGDKGNGDKVDGNGGG